MCGFVEKCFIAAVKSTRKNFVVCIQWTIKSIYLYQSQHLLVYSSSNSQYLPFTAYSLSFYTHHLKRYFVELLLYLYNWQSLNTVYILFIQPDILDKNSIFHVFNVNQFLVSHEDLTEGTPLPNKVHFENVLKSN